MEVIDRVGGWKKLLNPMSDGKFTGARCRQLNGLCIQRPSTIHKYADFMETTQNLHFRIAKDPSKDVVCIQNKHTIDVADWSPVEYLWCANGVRGANGSVDFSSWLEELKTAPSVPIKPDRHDELQKYLKDCQWRLDGPQLFAFQQNVRYMHTPRLEEDLHWAHDGRFLKEFEADLSWVPEVEPEDDESIQLNDRNCIIRSQKQRRELQNQPLVNMVRVGHFIAYKPFYNDDVPMNQRKPMYIGKITHINQAEQHVQIQCYFTGTTKPLEKKVGKTITYKPWRQRGSVFQDIKLCDIYHGFQPTMNSKPRDTLSFNLIEVVKKAIRKSIAGEALSVVLPD